MPDDGVLEHLADRLRAAVAASLAMAPDQPEAVRLAALADQIAARPGVCAGPGCDRPLPISRTGRPRRYCRAACRQRAHRSRPAP